MCKTFVILFFILEFPKVPKLIVIETSKDWAKFEWRKLKSEKIFYKVIVKDEGGEIQESGKVEKNSLKFKGLKEKKTYKAYLRVCASTKDCKESEGIEFKMGKKKYILLNVKYS